MNCYLLLTFVVVCIATDFDDVTCVPRRSTLAEMRQVDYAKTLTIGMHDCNTTYVIFDTYGHPSMVVTFPATVNTYYNATSGSIDSIYIADAGTKLIKEYADGKGGACIIIQDTAYYVATRDITRGAESTAFRIITMYERNRNKKLRAVQWLRPTDFGDSLLISNLDEEGHFADAVFQTCSKI